MIQRIQSLYLAVAAALLVLFVVLAETWASGIAAASGPLGTVAYAMSVLTAVAALVAIGLFKNRRTQRKVVFAAQWLDLALIVVVLVGLYTLTGETVASEVGEVETPYTVGRYLTALLPVVAYVLLRMARRGVERDIETVRSMDRLR